MNDTGIAPTTDPVVEEAVAFINGRIEQTVFDGAIEIGEYVLVHFFDNDISLISSKNPDKQVSFRKLCAHPDLAVSAQALNKMVRVAAQERFFKVNGIDASSLKYSHKIELTSLENNAEKLNIARRAISEALSVRELRDIIKQERKSLSDGSADLPAREQIERYMTRVRRFLKRARVPGVFYDQEAVAAFDKETSVSLYNKAMTLMSEFEQVASALSSIIYNLSEKLEPGEYPAGENDDDMDGPGDVEAGNGEDFSMEPEDDFQNQGETGGEEFF